MIPDLQRFDIAIHDREGPVDRTVPLVALAACLRVSPRELAGALRVLLYGVPATLPDAPEFALGKGTIGEGERSETLVPETLRSETFQENILPERFETLGGGPGEPTPVGDFGRWLAHALGDPRSVDGLQKLAHEHPRALLDEALRRTLAIPASEIRRSRGAAFTGIVRRLAATRWAPPSGSSLS